MVNDLDKNNNDYDGWFKKDGWINLMAGLGKKNSDKTTHTEPGTLEIFDDDTLSDIYDAPGLSSVIVDSVADDMIRSGWFYDNDDDQKIEEEMRRLNTAVKINEAVKYTRLYRGAIIVIITEKGKPEDPLRQDNGAIRMLRTYSAARIEPIASTDISEDPSSLYFDDVEYFNVRLRNGTPMKVHRTRCMAFKGELVSDYGERDLKYRYWGLSVIQKVWDALKNYSATTQGIANVMLEFNIGKYTLKNLASILAQNTNEAMQQIYNRIEIINVSKSVINAVLLGEGEEYTNEKVNLTGVGDIVDRMMMDVSSVSKIPVTRLFGRSPAGQNATGESDLRNYYDDVKNKQELWLKPEHQRLVNLIASYVYPNNKDNHEITYNSLWEPTQKEQSEMEYIDAQTDEINIKMNIIMPEEARNKRFPELDSETEIDNNLEGDE